MKEFLLILMLSIGIVSLTQAQGVASGSPEILAARVTTHITKILKLEGTQRREFYDIQLNFMQDRQRIMQKQALADGSSQPARLQLHSLQKEAEFNVRQLLSAEQVLLYNAYLEAQKARH